MISKHTKNAKEGGAFKREPPPFNLTMQIDVRFGSIADSFLD